MIFKKHVEDSNFYSLNYHHDGAPKTWIIADPNHFDQFVEHLIKLMPVEYGKCKQFYRHKNLLIRPQLFDKLDIKYETVKDLLFF